jgi:hypothetical protein
MAEERPAVRLIVDELPPIATKIWLITKYGNGYAGTYDKTDRLVVAWAPLPKLAPDQKRRLRAMEAAGVDPSIHPAVLYAKQEDLPASCVG